MKKSKTKLTAQEVIGLIEKAGISIDEFAYGDFESPEGVGEFEEVEQHGGEDEGSEWYSVKYFKDHDIYIKTEGYYTSYNGTDFESGYGNEVKPVKKSITIYE